MKHWYFAMDYRGNWRDGSAEHPFRDPGELPTPWTMHGGCEYMFRADTESNFAQQLALPGYTSEPILIGSWGAGLRPIIRRYRMVEPSECVEVAVAADGSTKPQKGTRIWRVPRQFFGLYAGRVWGVRCDIAGATYGADHRTPSALYEWGYADIAESKMGASRVIYSEGHPVEVYGGLFANTFSDYEFAVAYERATIYASQPGGGITVSGVDIEDSEYAVRAYCGKGGALLGLVIEDAAFRSVQNAIQLVGDGSMDSGAGFDGATLRGLYGENLGSTLLSTPGGGLCANGLRMSEFVVNGCGLSQSVGGVYLDHAYTNDGSLMRVQLGTVSGAKAGNFWPKDGYAFYQEAKTSGAVFERCFGWRNERNFHSNVPGTRNAFRHCTAIAMGNGTDGADVFHNAGQAPGCEVELADCLAVGFAHFCSGPFGSEGHYTISRNASFYEGPNDPHTSAAVRTHGYVPSCVTVRGNQFAGHGAALYDGRSGLDHSADVLMPILDHAGRLARLPVPTDPTVNYASLR